MSDNFSGIEREVPKNLPDSRVENITAWRSKILSAKKYFEKDFKTMRFNMRFVRGLQWVGQDENDDRYTANFVQHHIKNIVSSLYARNPTVVTRNKDRLFFELWDENPESLASAQQNIMMSAQMGMPPNPNDIMLIQDVQQGMAYKKMLKKVSKTLDIITKHEMDEQPNDFKLQMKLLVARVAITGVGYIKLLYQREFDYDRHIKNQIYDITTKMQTINRLMADVEDGEVTEKSKEVEELRMALTALQQSEQVISREGLVFEFPKATQIIVDPSCTNVEGFIDADWIAQQYFLSNEEIKEYYQKDIGSMSTVYRDTQERYEKKDKSKDYSCVWEVQDKKTGTYFTICDGYDDYLREPKLPDTELETFFNIKALVLNKTEDEEKIYPQSDVTLLRPIQEEYNRTRESIRQHRIANRPLYFAIKGAFEEETETAIANHAAHDVIYVNPQGDASLGSMVAPMQKAPIDPNVYESNSIFSDVQRTVGAPDSQFGGTSNATATENSIAASTRMTVTSSNADDIDDYLTRVFRDAGIILLSNVSIERAKKIAGRGAVWAVMSFQDMIDELYLGVEAGSSGRPNKAQDVANFERLAPFLLQMPNINPTYIAKYVLKILEDRMDLTEALVEGMPSIMAMNSMQQLSTGDAATDPNQQGSQGGNNAPAGQSAQGGNQAMFPALQNTE